MVVLRLARMGRKNKATFRIVAQDKRRATNSRVLEIVGSYNPHLASREQQIQLNVERVKHWLHHGAQASATVHNILIERGVIQAAKRRVVHAAPTAEKSTPASTEQQPTTPSTEGTPAA